MAATGIIGAPFEALHQMIASSTTFWTQSGTANAAQAYGRIYERRIDLGTGLAASTMFALIDSGDASREAIAGGTRTQYLQEGVLEVKFIRAMDDDWTTEAGEIVDYTEPYDTFMTAVGAIVSEVEALSGTAGYITIRDSKIGRPNIYEPKDRKMENADFVCIDWELTHGI